MRLKARGSYIAPFPFLMIAEGLGRLMRQGELKNMFSCSRIGKGNMMISMLQFADDVIILAEPNLKMCQLLRVFFVVLLRLPPV